MMELDQLKSDWNASSEPAKTNEELKNMLSANQHPVLKGIRRQFTIEILGWSAFLLCYYTMFDGDLKPLPVNVLLIAAVLSSLLHNVSGYNFSRYLVGGDNIRASLERYLSKIKAYAAVSITTRVIYFTGFLVFFTYEIEFNTYKYVLLAACGLLFGGQLVWLGRLWARRVKTLGAAIDSF